MREIKCKICNKKHTNKSFCSRECYYEYASINPNDGAFKFGHNKTKEHKNANWKGNKVGYGALHDWVSYHLCKPRYCECCGTMKAKKYEWCNISGEYKREKEDWKRMCVSCHRKLDGHSYKMWLTRRSKNA